MTSGNESNTWCIRATTACADARHGADPLVWQSSVRVLFSAPPRGRWRVDRSGAAGAHTVESQP